MAENFTRVSTVLADFEQFQDRFAQRGADVTEQDKELALLKVANEELRVSHAKQQEVIDAQAAHIKEQDEKLAAMEEKMAKTQDGSISFEGSIYKKMTRPVVLSFFFELLLGPRQPIDMRNEACTKRRMHSTKTARFCSRDRWIRGDTEKSC